MSSSPSLQVQQDDREGTVRLVGEITEDADFSAALAMGTGALKLNLEHVRRLNSCGVREWIHFVRELERRGLTIELHACSPAIVEQVNLISNFVGSARIKSVIVPLRCDGCGAQRSEVFVVAPGAEPVVSAPCSCGKHLELDEHPRRYFAFLGGT